MLFTHLQLSASLWVLAFTNLLITPYYIWIAFGYVWHMVRNLQDDMGLNGFIFHWCNNCISGVNEPVAWQHQLDPRGSHQLLTSCTNYTCNFSLVYHRQDIFWLCYSSPIFLLCSWFIHECRHTCSSRTVIEFWGDKKPRTTNSICEQLHLRACHWLLSVERQMIGLDSAAHFIYLFS